MSGETAGPPLPVRPRAGGGPETLAIARAVEYFPGPPRPAASPGEKAHLFVGGLAAGEPGRLRRRLLRRRHDRSADCPPGSDRCIESHLANLCYALQGDRQIRSPNCTRARGGRAGRGVDAARWESSADYRRTHPRTYGYSSLGKNL